MNKLPRKPVCTVTAAILPFVTYFLLFVDVTCTHVGNYDGYGAIGMFYLVMPISIVTSLVLSIISLARNERFWVLAVIEFVVFGILSMMTVGLFTN
jgi:hypothetical protein